MVSSTVVASAVTSKTSHAEATKFKGIEQSSPQTGSSDDLRGYKLHLGLFHPQRIRGFGRKGMPNYYQAKQLKRTHWVSEQSLWIKGTGL